VAICRCLEAHACPPSREGDYSHIHYVKPVGYPKTGPACGLCSNPAVIWLEEWEVLMYNNGERVFRLGARNVRVRADDSGVCDFDTGKLEY
jgi:hypothetical protein